MTKVNNTTTPSTQGTTPTSRYEIPTLPPSEYGSPGHLASVEKYHGKEAASLVAARHAAYLADRTARHAAIENHLVDALAMVRGDSANPNYQRAVGRVCRASALLKQLCAEGRQHA